MGLGHDGIEYVPPPQAAKGMDHVAHGVTTTAPLRDDVVLFGMDHSCYGKNQGARRGTFRERRANLKANPPIGDEEGGLKRS